MDSKEDQKPIRDNIMKYILLSILIIPFVSVMILFSVSTPVFGGTPKYYSVGQCVSLLTINKDISGTNELNEFREECEKIMKPLTCPLKVVQVEC